MKNLQKIVCTLMLTLVFVACGSSGDDPTSGSGTLTAKVDGTSFSSLKASVGATEVANIITIQGSDASGNFIKITINPYSGTGTYTTGDAISNLSSLIYGTINPVAAWSSVFDSGEGTITITDDDDNHVKGTFSFVGYKGSNDRKSITEGKFNAPKK